MIIDGHDLKINPKFESCIPPLTEEEFNQLRANIMVSETIYSPIVIWNDYIVDGHNRYKILQEHPDLMVGVFDLSIDYQTEEEVISWICSNQLGRRNLTPEQKKYLVGKQYEAERSMRGGDHCSEKAKSQNDGLLSANAAERVAQKNNTNSTYVQRAFQYAKGIDKMEAAAPGTREKVLNGQMKIPHASVEALGKEKRTSRDVNGVHAPNLTQREKTITRLISQLPPLKESHPSEYYYSPRLDATAEDVLKYGFVEMDDALRTYCSRWNCVKNMYGHMFDDPAVNEGLEELLQRALKYIHGFRTDKVPYKGCEENE